MLADRRLRAFFQRRGVSAEPGSTENVKDNARQGHDGLPQPAGLGPQQQLCVFLKPEMWQEKLQEGRWLEEMPAAMAGGNSSCTSAPGLLSTLQVTSGEALVRWVNRAAP